MPVLAGVGSGVERVVRSGLLVGYRSVIGFLSVSWCLVTEPVVSGLVVELVALVQTEWGSMSGLFEGRLQTDERVVVV